MDTAVRIVAEDDEQLRQLQKWLVGDDDLRGRVVVDARLPEPGELGIGVDTLLTVLAPGGVAAALVGGLFAWLQSRASPVRLRLVRPDGSEVELETRVAGRISAAQLLEVVDSMATWAGGGPLGPAAARMLPHTPPAEPDGNEAGRAGSA